MREAKAKIGFEERIRTAPETWLVNKLHRRTIYMDQYTTWRKDTFCDERYRIS